MNTIKQLTNHRLLVVYSVTPKGDAILTLIVKNIIFVEITTESYGTTA